MFSPKYSFCNNQIEMNKQIQSPSEEEEAPMASSSKSEPDKSKKKATKTLTNDPAKKEKVKSKTSNGVARAPASDSERESPAKKSNKKPKRDRSEDERDDAKAVNKFPMERVRRIIRSEDSEIRVTNEAVFLVNKATERFLEKFCGDSHDCCVQDRKKSLSYKHLASAVNKWKRYDFLSDFVPVKVKAEDALAEMKSMEPEAD